MPGHYRANVYTPRFYNPFICCTSPASPTQVCKADTALEKEVLALSRSPPPSALPSASRLELTSPDELWDACVLLKSAIAFLKSAIQPSLHQNSVMCSLSTWDDLCTGPVHTRLTARPAG
jgi:hypothetical protein